MTYIIESHGGTNGTKQYLRRKEGGKLGWTGDRDEAEQFSTWQEAADVRAGFTILGQSMSDIVRPFDQRKSAA